MAETQSTVIDGQTVRAKHILTRSVALVLRCGYQGNHRRVELDALKMEKDGAELNKGEKDEMGANKRLFSTNDLRPASKAIDAIKNRLRAMSVDGGTRLFGDGTYLLPLLGVPEALKTLKEGQVLVAEKAEELANRLPQVLEQRAQKLGPLFVSSEYPTADEVRAAYRVSWTFVSFSAPDQLESVDVAAYEAAVADNNARLNDAYSDVVIGLREGASLVMRELANKLLPDKNGKPKALQPAALDDLNNLLARLPVLNSIAQDADLADALARIGVLAEGLDVDVVRKAPAIRAMLLEEATKTVESLDALVTSGRRAMDI